MTKSKYISTEFIEFLRVHAMAETLKHITSLIVNDHAKITDQKEILEEEERFFKQIYASKNMNPNGSDFKEFFKTENVLSEETAKTCDGIMSIVECERAL